MTIEELQIKLNASQERLDKAIKLRDKYQVKFNTLQAKCEEVSKDYPLDDNLFVAMNWDTIPADIYNLYHDRGYAKEAMLDSDRKIKELTQIRDNWKTRLELQKAKDEEFANIPQIVKDFVHSWRVKTEEWIKDNLEAYTKARKEALRYYERAHDWSLDIDKGERECLMQTYNNMYDELRRTTDAIIITIYSRGSEKEEFIKKLLDDEERDKIFDLIKRVTKVTGTITDASNLRIGEQNGELNGLVVGQEGKAFVETIGAGGYNIQRFHYRVLVKKIKE